jgi:CO/xanthine dehydrogenase Mo-binding subunit
MVTDLRGGLDATGNIIAWDGEAWTTWGARGYALSNVRSVQHYVQPLLRTMWMRSPAQVPTNFPSESFMDELAAAAGADPIEFRLRYMMSPDRDVDLIGVVRKSSGWVTRPSPNSSASTDARIVTGRGFARGRGVQTVVEVAVDRQTGRVNINQGWLAYSPGQIVNPDGLTNQLEQATLQGFSRALMEEVQFDTSNVTSVDWVSHPIFKFSDIPKLHIDIVNRPELPLNGAGEMATDPAISAIGNAIFDATGVRIRRIPFTPERVLAALKQREPTKP